MIYLDKDPTLRTLLVQEALAARGLYTGALDNWPGPRTQDALSSFRAGFAAAPPTTTATGNKHRDVHAAGVDLIKRFEGLFLKAYRCPAGVWTIGYGHTGLKHNDGTVHAGRAITREQAEALLRHDLDVFEGRVLGFIDVPLTDNEFAALVSFDFNTGGLGDSTLRRKLNAGDRQGAAAEFARWNKAGGKTLAGLTRRRAAEREMFLCK